MKFVLIKDIHINIDQIRSFAWKDGELCVWYADRHFFESWPDPEKKAYKKLCNDLDMISQPELLRSRL